VPYKYRLVLHIQRIDLQYVLHYLTKLIRHFFPSQPSGTCKHHALLLHCLFLTFNHYVCALAFRALANAIKANSTWFRNSQETVRCSAIQGILHRYHSCGPMLMLEEVAHDWHLGYLGALGLLGAIRLLSLHVDVWRLIF
jgi:hypothetical protein